jgi:hypothetical protein
MDTCHLKTQMTVSYHNVSNAKIRNYFDFVERDSALILIAFVINKIKR